MIEAFFTASLITAGIIIGLGPQNIFVIKQGIRGKYILTTVLICEFCEILTVSLGALGAGYLFSQNDLLQKIIGALGILFLLVYGFKAFREAYRNHAQSQAHIDIERQSVSLKEVIITSFSISLLNPWALMDTMVIIGGGAAQYESVDLMIAFVCGSLVVSTIWFFAIGYGAKKLRRFLNTPRATLIMDVVAGLVMWSAALYLTRTILMAS